MAWNTPGKGGGSDKGGKDPWKGRDPDSETDAFLNRLKQGMGRMFGDSGNGDSGQRIAMWAGIVLLAWLLFSSFQLVDETQRGVVLRFGQFSRIMTPGVNLKWPWPVEAVTKVEATKVRSASDQVRMLTRDQNIVLVDYNVQYSVSDPRLFLFGNRDPEKILQQAAESVVREVVGASAMDDVLIGQSAVRTAHARERLQASLDQYRTGLLVSDFTLKNVRPPQEVKEAFDDVTRARQDKDRKINEARAYASQIVPVARGDAASVRIGAEGYKAKVIAAAQGDSQRYSLLAEQYRKAPEVTRKRLYLETMEAVLSGSPKVVAGRGNNTIYLPADRSGASASTAAALAPVTLPAVTATVPAASDDSVRPDRAPRSDGREEPRQ